MYIAYSLIQKTELEALEALQAAALEALEAAALAAYAYRRSAAVLAENWDSEAQKMESRVKYRPESACRMEAFIESRKRSAIMDLYLQQAAQARLAVDIALCDFENNAPTIGEAYTAAAAQDARAAVNA